MLLFQTEAPFYGFGPGMGCNVSQNYLWIRMYVYDKKKQTLISYFHVTINYEPMSTQRGVG